MHQMFRDNETKSRSGSRQCRRVGLLVLSGNPPTTAVASSRGLNPPWHGTLPAPWLWGAVCHRVSG